jgi:hypothetical protein
VKAFSATAILCVALLGSTAFSAEEQPAQAQAQAQSQTPAPAPAPKPLTQKQYECIANAIEASGLAAYETATYEEIERAFSNPQAYGYDKIVYLARRMCGIRHR